MNEMVESDSDQEIACAAAAYVLLSGDYLRKKTEKRKRRWWDTSLNKSRKDDVCKAIIQELKEEIKQLLPKSETPGPSVFLCSLLFSFSLTAHLEQHHSLMRIPHPEMCWDELGMDECGWMLPENEDEWLCIAQQFENQWNFPNCLGAIDGKHVVIQCPNNTSTEFFKYKGTFSVVLLALVDARYCFTFVDIGCQGRISDGGIFNNSVLLTKLKMEQLKLPPNRKLQPLGKNLPYVFLGDSAFALSRHMMKPYPGNFEKGSTERIFNYRLSRARRVVENVFGIMASAFRVFRKPMALQPDKVSDVTLACVLLHNFMRKSASSTSFYSPPGTFDIEADGDVVSGSWRNDQSGMTSFMPLKKAPRKSGQVAKATRNCFAEYFSTSGKLSWQDKYC
ncbi:putative nuclease HARBI1 like protein [Argiope bruennichi]|uniref:Putative nuclease HARBI1 like protein n=1 Tax=Argiope bruennichi TaxID=94029 RepID=A0A8T0EXH2_ARGBR|nr:putative nuclease HARBI1 like protein [Argiope bruennichi]